jgi:hypothetical protein
LEVALPVRIFFREFETPIRGRFATAVAEAGNAAKHLTLELHDEPSESRQWAAEFCVTPPNGPVRITWAGIASLWACSQGGARIARRMFVGKRQGREILETADDPELQTGFQLFELCRRLCKQDFLSQPPNAPKWVDWAPMPELVPTTDDAKSGNAFFFGALGWIMRHEIAHVTLQHSVVVNSIAAENDADRQATEWLQGAWHADPNRQLGAPPEKSELELELRAIAIGVGLVWVAMFESLAGQSSVTHPPSAERFFRSINLLALRQDSMAAEVLFDILQAWIEPTGKWAPNGGYPDAITALNDALDRLYSFYR